MHRSRQRLFACLQRRLQRRMAGGLGVHVEAYRAYIFNGAWLQVQDRSVVVAQAVWPHFQLAPAGLAPLDLQVVQAGLTDIPRKTQTDHLREPAGQFHAVGRSEEHTSELQSLMRNSYSVL